MPLSEYRRKRRSGRRPESSGRQGRRRRGSDDGPRFVIQHHAARSDHYDFRLEIGGVLVSWAIPKGPLTNPKDKRMARRTEDHPLEYATFEGVIPEGQYGAGGVIVWDHGIHANATTREMTEGLERGHLSFRLHGEQLRRGKDEDADARRKPVRSQLGVPPACGGESVLSGRTLDELS
jgi:DNA ligase D-like protein (predicted 3'-phosphoesterase)